MRDAFPVSGIPAKQQVWRKGADIVSAASLVLGKDGNYFDVTGTTTVTEIVVRPGVIFMLQFDGILTLTNSATLDLPGAANFTTAAGDRLIGFAEAENSVQILSLTKADGKAVVSGHTKEFIVYPTDLDVAGTGTFPFITNVGDFIPLVVANTSLTHFHFFVPNDFTSLTDAVVVVIPDATETIQWDVTTDFGASGESRTANSDSDLNATLAVTADELSEADVSPALTAIAANDNVGMAFASDTDNIRPIYLRFKYT